MLKKLMITTALAALTIGTASAEGTQQARRRATPAAASSYSHAGCGQVWRRYEVD